MVRSAWIAAAALCATIGGAPAPAAEKRLLVGSFDDIVIDGDIRVILQTNKPVSARATGDKRQLDYVRLERTGTTLRVRLQEAPGSDRAKPMSEPLVITLANRHLHRAVLRGNAKLDVDTMASSDGAGVLISGSGIVNVGRVTADRFEVQIIGNGQLSIGSGTVREGKVHIDGNGIYTAPDMSFRKLALTQYGNGKSSASIVEMAEITNNGSGSISIGGKGNCFIRQAGAAQITCPKIMDGK